MGKSEDSLTVNGQAIFGQTAYQNFAELSPHAITLVENGRVVYINPAGLKLLGAESPDQVIGQPVMDRVHPDSKKMLRERSERLTTSGDAMPFIEQKIIKLDGSTIWTNAASSVIELNGKKFIQVVSRNISDRKKLEDQLLDSEKKYRNLVEKAGIGILIDDARGNVIYFNDKLAEIFGYTHDELRNKNIEDLVYPNDLDDGRKQHRQRLASRKFRHQYQFRGIKKDGTEIYVEVDASFEYDNGSFVRARSYVRDITNRRQLRNELIESEQRYRDLVEKAGIAIVVDDHNGQFTYFNDTFVKLFGYSAEELKSHSIRTLVHPDDLDFVWQQHSNRIKNANAVLEYEFRGLCKNGEVIFLKAFITALRKGKEIIGTRSYITDLTEQRKTQHKMIESQKQLQALFDNALDIIVFMDNSRKCTDANPAAVKLIGYSLDELRQIPISNLLTQQDRGYFDDIWDDFLKQGRASGLMNFVNKSGENICIEYQAVADILPGLHIAILRDVTLQKQSENALQSSEEKYRLLVDNASDGIVVAQDGYLKFVNPRICEFTGRSKEYLLSASFLELIHPDDRAMVADYHTKRMKGEPAPEFYEIKVVGKDGQTKWATVSGVSITWDGKPASLNFLSDITARKMAEDGLRQSQETYRNIFHNAQVGLFRTRISDGLVMECNDAAALMFGFDSREGMIDNYITQNNYTDPEAREKMLATIRDHGEIFGFETEFKRVDGSTFWVRYSARSYPEQGWLEGVIEDITDRKITEMALAAREATLRSIFRAAPVGIGLVSNRIIKNMNDQMSAMTGYKPSELIDKSARLLYASEEEFLWVGQEKYAQIFKNGTGTVEAQWVRKDGKIIDVLLSSTPINPENYAEGVTFTALDITERKQAEQALVKSEKRYQELFDSVQEGLCLLDESETILFCNPAAAQILEEDSTADVTGKNFLDYVVPEQRDFVLHQTALRRQGKNSQYDLEVITSKGKIRKILASVSPRHDESGNFIGAFGAIIDITETRRLQELESRAQRLESAGRIAGQVAHDFNNLLAPLVAYPEFIREELPIDHPALPLIEDMENAARQIADINQQLLTLGRRGHYTQETLRLNDIVKMVINQIESGPDTLILDVNLDPDLMNIKGGRAQILRVISNLLHNARDAVQNVGQVSIRTENFYADEIAGKYGRVPQGEYVKLTVSDTGSGVPEDIQQRIFEPFFTTKTTDKKRGSGLGLSVVDAVVKDHDGYIDLETKLGRGTSIYLYFPITRDALIIEENDLTRGSNENLLVVDDDAMQCDVTVKMLKKLGYRVKSVESGEEALKILRTETFDLLILDMVIPMGIDGTETYQKALEINPDQKAIIVSGYAETERVNIAMKTGAGAFTKKPLTLKSISAAVKKGLGKTADNKNQ